MDISSLRFTNVQHCIFYFHNNTFYSVIYKIKVNLPLLKGKNIIYGISDDFIYIIIKMYNLQIIKTYLKK